MRHELNLWVAGGDMRQAKLAELLADDGHTVHSFALEKQGQIPGVVAERIPEGIGLADCVVLPLPVAGEGSLLNTPLSAGKHPLAALLDALNPSQVICAGMVGDETAHMAQSRGLTLHDYYAREELAVANAVPTAEGAIQIAMEELPITVHGCRALIIGYGRVGRALAPRLAGLGAKVSVAGRKFSDLAWAENCGYGIEHADQLAGWICGYDLVVNTVPSRILGERELRDLRPGGLVIDLASKPGGADVELPQGLPCARTCIHKLMQPSFRTKSPHAAAKYLVIRQYDCGILPCLRRFRLENLATAAYEYRF